MFAGSTSCSRSCNCNCFVTIRICPFFALQLYCNTCAITIITRYNSKIRTLLLQQICFINTLCTYLHKRYAKPYSMPHQGEILQEAIKNSGISITRIVDELGITRPTIYRKFKEATVDYSFVKKVGEIINHDFSSDFTALQQSAISFVTTPVRNTVPPVVTSRVITAQVIDADPSRQLLLLQAKYISLLEAYNELLLKVYGPK